MASEPCFFCTGPVNPHDASTWKQVVGWVGGLKKDGLTLRHDTERYAHDHCVQKERSGQPTDQPDLLGDDTGAPALPAVGVDITPDVVREVFGDAGS